MPSPGAPSDPFPPAAVPHLYVHVPFCPTICPFCSFHVLRRRDDLVEAYLRRLDDELAHTADTWVGQGRLDTVYLGGGTPSHLSDHELERLVGSIRRRFDVAADAEWTLEAHPRNITPDRPPRWGDLGFNRISVGVQSTQDHVLAALGRGYDAATALNALDAVLAVPGLSVNADLITVAPGQDVEVDLRRLAATSIDHVAAYTLTIEPGTPFERRHITVDEEAQRRALLAAKDILGAAGLHRYEVSNHARPGHRCRHNQGYWENRFWFGVGPSATAHLPTGPAGVMARNATLEGWLAGEPPLIEPLDPLDRARQIVLAGLRLTDGFDLDRLTVRMAGLGGDPDAAGRGAAVVFASPENAKNPTSGDPMPGQGPVTVAPGSARAITVGDAGHRIPGLVPDAGRLVELRANADGADPGSAMRIDDPASAQSARHQRIPDELAEVLGRIDSVCHEGLLVRHGQRVRVSDEGLLVLDQVLARIW